MLRIIFFLIIFIGCSQMDNKAPLIPMEDFFRNPEKSSFKISPDGNLIAYMKPWQTRMNVYVMDIKTKNETRLTSSEERGIYGFAWLTNERIGYVKDDGGNENVTTSICIWASIILLPLVGSLFIVFVKPFSP